MVVSGWKEIAGYLRCGVRTVQRWERRGLPVHRPIPGKRSHVVAYSEELDWWVRDHQARLAPPENVVVSIGYAKKLREQARAGREELRAHMRVLRQEVANLRAHRRKTLAIPAAKLAPTIVAAASSELPPGRPSFG